MSYRARILHAADFGGRSDAEILQHAIDEAAGRALYLEPRVYEIDRELVIREPVHLIGEGVDHRMTTLQARDGLRSVIHAEARVDMDRITIDAAGSLHGVHCAGAAFSQWHLVRVRQARSDGIALRQVNDAGQYANNDCMVLRQCGADTCGMAWADPSLSLHLMRFLAYPWQRVETPLSCELDYHAQRLTVEGVALESLGLRPGDVVGIGWDEAQSRWAHRVLVRAVLSDTELHIVGWSAEQANLSGPCVILRGDGYNEERSGDNSSSRFEEGVYRGCAGHGLGFYGLYGPTVDAPIIDYNAGGGVRLGLIPSSGILGPDFRGVYFETNGGADYTLCTGHSLAIYEPGLQQEPDVWYAGGPHSVRGIWQGISGLRSLGEGAYCRLGVT